MDWPAGKLLLMFLLGLPCGLVAVTAGGGVTLGVPLMMLAGVEAGVAVIAVKVALWAAFLAGSASHLRDRPRFAVPTPWWIWPLCAASAAFGASLLANLDPQRLRSLVLALLIGSTLGSFWTIRIRRDAGTRPSGMHRVVGHVVVVLLAAYSGFFGAGYGVFLIWALVSLHGHSPASAAALGTRLSLLVSSASVVVFIRQGVVPWPSTLPLAAGCALGGVLGALATRRLGDGFIRWSTWVVSTLIAVKLLVSG